MMNAASILDQVVSYTGLTRAGFAKSANLHPTQVYDILNGKTKKISEDVAQKIVDNYINISKAWLLTGEGEMLREGAPSTPPAEESTNFRFRLPVTAEAGTLIGISEGVTPADCERVPRIFALPDYDNTILISGNSMSPKYESGDEVAIKRAKNIMWGYVYVLDTTDGIVIKRIYDNGKSIRCNSYNPEYPDFEIPKEDVYGAFRVIGIIRRGEM